MERIFFLVFLKWYWSTGLRVRTKWTKLLRSESRLDTTPDCIRHPKLWKWSCMYVLHTQVSTALQWSSCLQPNLTELKLPHGSTSPRQIPLHLSVIKALDVWVSAWRNTAIAISDWSTGLSETGGRHKAYNGISFLCKEIFFPTSLFASSLLTAQCKGQHSLQPSAFFFLHSKLRTSWPSPEILNSLYYQSLLSRNTWQQRVLQTGSKTSVFTQIKLRLLRNSLILACVTADRSITWRNWKYL